MFSNHNGMKLQINNRKFGKITHMWKLNIILLNKQLVKSNHKEK